MTQVTTVGIDLAKNVFSLHGVNHEGKVIVQRTVTPAVASACRRSLINFS